MTKAIERTQADLLEAATTQLAVSPHPTKPAHTKKVGHHAASAVPNPLGAFLQLYGVVVCERGFIMVFEAVFAGWGLLQRSQGPISVSPRFPLRCSARALSRPLCAHQVTDLRYQ